MIWLAVYLTVLAVALVWNYAAHSSPRRSVSNQQLHVVQTPARGTTVETRRDADPSGASPVS